MKLVVAAAVAAAVAAHVCVAEEIMLPMRDGVKLATAINTIVLDTKSTPSNLTTIIDRSPYGIWALPLIGLGFGLAEGFAAVRQDQRGTQQSEGQFTFWHNAANDTEDTIRYIVNQPWSNGRVVSIGASADGLASLAAITKRQQHLVGQSTIFATARGYETIFVGGAMRLSLSEFWLESTVPDQAAALIQELKRNEAPGKFWDALDLQHNDAWAHVNFASSFWAGWYDIFLVGNLIGFEGYYHNSDPGFREQAVITVDPCGHCQDAASSFGKNDILGRALLPVLQAYDVLKRDGAGDKSAPLRLSPEGVKAVTFYVLGDDGITTPGNYWTTMDDWPVYTVQKWYMNSADKSLSTTAPPASGASLSYMYDPTNPAPTLGGNNLKIKCGPRDQTPNDNRPDVLTFTSAKLTAPVAITGPLHAHLWVSSSAKDTDFVVKLIDVFPGDSGKGAHLVQDGIVRMKWRDLPKGATTPTNMTAGQVYAAQASLWNTSYVFAPGHQLRVQVTSSNYPRFTINRNTGWALADGGPNVTAHNTVYFDASRPSSIDLPTVQLSQLPKVDVLDITRKHVASLAPHVRDAVVSTASALELSVAKAAGKSSVPQGLVWTPDMQV